MESLGAMDEFVGNNVMGTVGPLDGDSFNMLTYLDDTSLLNQLGLEPTTLTDDCHTKLLDSNTTDNYTELVPPLPSQQESNNYTELLAPSPQDGGGNCYMKLLDASVNYDDLLPSNLPQQETCVTDGQATYYTITLDVEPPHVDNVERGATTSNTLLDTSVIGTLNPLILSATPVAQTQQHLTTLTVNDSEQLGLNNTPMIIQLQDNTSAVLTSPEEVVDSLSPSPLVPNKNRGGETRQPKRGNRKRQQTEEEAAAGTAQVKPAPKRRRPKKEKKYEITKPIEDPDEEKKRLNAINAKKNRDKKKDLLKELSEKVLAVAKERDNLLQEVESLKQREASLRKQLAAKHGVHWNSLDNFPII